MKHLKSVRKYMMQRFASKNNSQQNANININIDYKSNCLRVPYLKISCDEVESPKNMEQLEISSCKFKLTYIQDAHTDDNLKLIENKIHEYMKDAPKHIKNLQGVMFLKSSIKYADNTISIEYSYNLLF